VPARKTQKKLKVKKRIIQSFTTQTEKADMALRKDKTPRGGGGVKEKVKTALTQDPGGTKEESGGVRKIKGEKKRSPRRDGGRKDKRGKKKPH